MKQVLRHALVAAIFFSFPIVWASYSFRNLRPFSEKENNEEAEQKTLKQWTVLIYMGADNNLEDFSREDISHEILAAKIAGNVNVLLQVDFPNENGTFRYKVEDGRLVLAQSLSREMGVDPEGDLVSAMQWAATYEADNYILNLWGHGSGPLEPSRRIPTGLYFMIFHKKQLFQQMSSPPHCKKYPNTS